MKKTFGVFVIFLAAYLLTISRVPSISNDSINYIWAVDSGEWFFHPHHLFYHVFALGFFNLLKLLHISSDSVFGIASLNSIFGALSIALIFNILNKQLKFNDLTAFIIASIIGFSFGFWFYSCCVEVYIIPLFLILLGYYWYFRYRTSTKAVILISLAFGTAILFHQVYALLPVVVWIIFLVDKPARKPVNFIISGIIISIIPTISYLLIMKYRYGLHSPSDMYNWMTLYGHRMAYLWNKPSFDILPMISFGFFRAIFSIHPIYKSQFFLNLYDSYGRNHFIEDDKFLVRNLVPSFFYIYIILIVIAVSVIVYVAAANRKMIKYNFSENRLVILSFLAFELVYTIFFSFWDSTNLEFWIPQSVFFWLVFFILTRNSNRFRANIYAAVTLLFLMLFINWFSTIRFVDSIDNDYYYHVVRETEKQAKPGDLLIFTDGWIIKDYYKKFSDLRVYSLENSKEKKTLYDMQYLVTNTLKNGAVIAESGVGDYLKTNSSPELSDFWQKIISTKKEYYFQVRDEKFMKITFQNK